MSGIKLRSLKYAERVGKPKEWRLDDLTLGQVNLIVGTNATGKTRTLNLIANLARMFVPEPKLNVVDARYDVLFDDDGQSLHYILHVEDEKTTREEFYKNEQCLLRRGPGGEGEIFAEEEGKSIRFKPPENELAAVIRRDSLQHPYLESLHEWALSVRHYMFGTALGKDHLAVLVQGGPEVDDRNASFVVGIFRRAEHDLGSQFVATVVHDMASLQYDLESIELRPLDSMRLVHNAGSTEVHGICVKERGIEGLIDQNDMSQGMFRVLSVLIQVNYAQITGRANCILIDDIGEGLDFDRSTQLVELLRQKTKKSSMQLIMTTNDRFVMNHVPLEEWTVLRRQGSRVQVRNYENSREIFEEFKFTGLSNFSFLEMGFLNGQPEEEAAVHE